MCHRSGEPQLLALSPLQPSGEQAHTPQEGWGAPFQLPGRAPTHRGTNALHGSWGMATMCLGPKCPLHHWTREVQSAQLGNDRGGRGQPSLGKCGPSRGGLKPVSVPATQPHRQPPRNPYPTPNMASACSPIRSRFMLAAAGSKRGRWARGAMCREDGDRRREGAGRHPNRPLLHLAGWQPVRLPLPAVEMEPTRAGARAAPCPAGRAEVWAGGPGLAQLLTG